MNQRLTRRTFVNTLARIGATLVANPLTGWAIDEPDPKLRSLVAKMIGIDTHNHMDVPFNSDVFKSQNYDVANELKRSGLTAICMTFCVDRPKLVKEGEAYERFLTSLNELDELLNANHLTRAFNYADLKRARKENQQIVIQSVEGGHFIEGKVERIQTAYERGVRHLGLMHDGQTSPPMGDIYTDAPQYGGLTQLGKEVINECNKRGILIDLAHCSHEAINQALDLSTKPIIISHTGLNTQLGNNMGMAKMMRPRLISKEQAKTVADAGGVIGVWTHLADTPLEYAKNIRALVEVVGSEHVCLGTDTKMALPSNANERLGKITNTSWEGGQVGFFYTVVEALLKTGFTEKEIAQIGGDNYCRLFDKATTI